MEKKAQATIMMKRNNQNLVKTALARWFGWLNHRPIHQKVVGSIPSQGTHLGCGFDPRLGHVWKATDRGFSLTLTVLSPALPSSLSKINKHIHG